ncbi:MAG: DUF6445 family protein [Erythrobacter sp.]|uniref:DUF6445 family protein n=1 Tax=Erythrobacter sp. TaxID=1042 RepID=UPI0025F4280A|nr:DUF6445 family protein [Erythrobacter sp.]MCL9999624.1 DUF6445 family protein [Erythrobacter sp.]
MASQPASPRPDAPARWGIALADWREELFCNADQYLVSLDNFLVDPDHAVSQASLQKFAKITPQYPGVRAALDPAVCAAWLAQLAPLLDQWFGTAGAKAGAHPWAMQAWYSLVTTPRQELAPMQRLPHVDGTDPQQIAMMLYLHRTGHGGTAFFRHRSTGLEALTAQDYPRYSQAVQAEYGRTGLPPAAYPTDGAPHFERVHVAQGRFNRAVFYRGNLLHSGVIDNDSPLHADPCEGRLTINAFFRPAPG